MNEKNDQLTQLPELLLPWFDAKKRALPWRADRAPYHVWLSEIMLQQTRVEAVRGYYARFLAALPTVADLAAADPDRLHKLWEGLGYYSRVRNLQAAARIIMDEHGGEFPREYDRIRALPGIGDYCAGAISSICFEQPTPAVDGNVLRVWARLLGDRRPVNEEQTKRACRADLAPVYPAGRCGDFTQALMELGATVCLPNGAPQCERCPLSSLCRAKNDELWRQLPVKTPKKPRRSEDLTVFVLECGGAWAVRKRPASGLLAGLWEYPNVPGHLDAPAALAQAETWGLRPQSLEKMLERTHIFTHVSWQMRCYYLHVAARAEAFTWADRAALQTEIALPTAFRMFSEFRESDSEGSE